jgi:hypothetical protein
MSFTPEPVTRTCPECGAVNSRRAASCWLCFASLGAGAERPPAEFVTGPAPSAPLIARVTGVLLALLVVQVALGIFANGQGSAWSWLAVVFLLAAAPALYRVFRAGFAERAPGRRRLSILQILGVGLASVGVTALVGLAAVVLFVATCFPVGLASFSMREGSNAGIAAALVVGILAAGAGAYLVVWGLFRSSRS